MKEYFKIVFLLMLFSSCKEKSNSLLSTQKKEIIIHIVPLGNVDANLLSFVKTCVDSFYKCDCIIESKKELTEDILTDSKTRYEASRILKKYNSTQNTLLLTEKDIACNNKERGIKEWGIFGLGYRPGKTCVISTFRLKRSVSFAKLKERLQKVCLHEVGHNLGLPHCHKDSLCLMNDANGTISQVDKEKVFFCRLCKNKIGMK